MYTDTKKVPDKLEIKVLQKEFKPAAFPHLKIVNKLLTISNNSTLARVFHGAREQTLCEGCHHNSQLHRAAVKVPQCSSCHGRPFNPADLGKPGILAAYHRQCMGCHQVMKQKPTALECTKCHPAKKGVTTAHLAAPGDTAEK